MGICCCRSSGTQKPDSLDVSERHDETRWRLGVDGRRRGIGTDALVLDALNALRKLADNDEEPPECMTVLHYLAEDEDGWLDVVRSCIFAIPLEDSLGSAVVSFLLDECPLPTRDAIKTLVSGLNLNKTTDEIVFCTRKEMRRGHLNPAICRNLAVVLACLADKLAGPMSILLLSTGTLEFLLERLNTTDHPAVTLFSILALEKFAQTSENKQTIQKSGISDRLVILEREFLNNTNYLKHQVGFCAQWSLDNTFPCSSHPFSYLGADVRKINTMLNNNDVSEYLKISPTGLEARCDAASFESVRCTFCVDDGVWYYEVSLLTAGVMQIGWATKESKFLNHDGYGIGDDEFSFAYDGCRQLIWHNAKSTPHNHRPWRPGDVLGLLLDLDKHKVKFSLNGNVIEREFKAAQPRSGFFAASSFMSFQHCIFNFGSEPFKYPPRGSYKCFNDHARMKDEEKIILPKHLKLAALRQESVSGEPCKICFEKEADTKLEPCNHRDICMSCASQVTECPICRQLISAKVLDHQAADTSDRQVADTAERATR